MDNRFQTLSIKSYVLLLATSSLLLATMPVAYAQTPTCQPIYGGGKFNCNGSNLSVDKTVQDVQSGSFVQNMGVNDARYSPESTVIFRVVVKNAGTETLKNITIKDSFPKYVTYTSGEGKYDTNTKALTITLGSLEGGKSQSYDLKAKVARIQDLPQDQAVLCATNEVIVKSNDQSISDKAQFCIQRQAGTGGTQSTSTTNVNTPTGTPLMPSTTKGGQVVYPVTTNQTITKSPSTGPEALALFALAPLAGLGHLLRKKSTR